MQETIEARPKDWRLVSPAFVLGDPATSTRRYDMSDYSQFAEVTRVMVYQPADPLADGRNGRALEEGVFECDADDAEGLPPASSEQRAAALRAKVYCGQSIVVRGERPSIEAPKRMRAEAIAERAVAEALSDAWNAAREIKRNSQVRLSNGVRKFKDRRAIGADEVGTVIWEGYEAARGYAGPAVARYGVRYDDGTTYFSDGYKFEVENAGDEMPDFEETVQAAYGSAYENAMATLPENPMMFHPANAVVAGETDRSAWYDTTPYDCPFTGPFNAGEAHDKLNVGVGARAASLGKFGGYCSYNVKGDNGNGTFRYECVYHLGD